MGFRGVLQWQCPVDICVYLPGSGPAVAVVGGLSLFFRAGIEHGKAVERAVFHIEWADRKNRLCLAASHNEHASTPGKKRHGTLEVWLAQCFPPHIHAIRCE